MRFNPCHCFNPDEAVRDAAIRDQLISQLGEFLADSSDQLTTTKTG